MQSLEDLFNIDVENPQMYLCKIWQYVASHQMLTILLQHMEIKTKRLSVLFTHVHYFSGPTSWQGADWVVRSLNQADIPLVRTIAPFSDFESDGIEQYLRNYIMINAGNNMVQIIASTAEKRPDPLTSNE